MGQNDIPTTVKRLPGSPGKLNVILHGLFIFDEDDKKNQIIAYIPNMGSEHLYKAGNWLAETTLAERADLTLGTVTAGNEDFHPEHNIFLKDAHVTDASCCDRVYATLRLPRPPFPIRSLDRLKVARDAIGGDSTAKIVGFDDSPVLQSATVQVLTYPFDSDSDLQLGDHPWEPVLDAGFVNLHVFSEPERPPEQEHVRHAFQMSTGLFTGVDLSLRRPMSAPDRAAAEEEKKNIPGVHELEFQGFVQRQQLLSVLGRAIKDHRDLNGIWEDLTAFAGEDPESCPGSAASS